VNAVAYKQAALGLIFLQYISDGFRAKHAELKGGRAAGANPLGAEEYAPASIFWLPWDASW
jgi:hypothetical protein